MPVRKECVVCLRKIPPEPKGRYARPGTTAYYLIQQFHPWATQNCTSDSRICNACQRDLSRRREWQQLKEHSIILRRQILLSHFRPIQFCILLLPPIPLFIRRRFWASSRHHSYSLQFHSRLNASSPSLPQALLRHHRRFNGQAIVND